MPNCGMEPATVARKMPIDVMAKSCNAVPSRKSKSDPSIGMASRPLTTTNRENAEATSTTRPMDQTLLSMISSGVTGMTSRCSTVPCSRSRMSAAPVSTIDSMVMAVMMLLIDPNHDLSSSGLKRERSVRSTGTEVAPR